MADDSFNGVNVQIDAVFPKMDASSAVYPTVRIAGDQVHLAYYLPGCGSSAVVTFLGVSSWGYGAPNDEGLATHPLWGHGLTPYNFHEIKPHTTSGHRWIVTFHDGTFEIVASAVTIRAQCAEGFSPSAALDQILGEGTNRVLDEESE